MSDFLSNIVARTLAVAQVVQPRVPTVFEPLPADQLESPSATPASNSSSLASGSSPLIAGSSSIKQDDSEVKSASRGFIERAPVVPPTWDRSGQTQSTLNKSLPELKDKQESSTPSASGILLERSKPNMNRTAVANQGSTSGVPQTLESGSTLRRREVVELESIPRSSQSLTAESSAATFPDPENFGSNLRHPALLLTNSAGRSFSARAASSQTRTPNVKIVIGRVDVRAIMPPPVAPGPPTPRPKPGLSLEDYLKQREEGKR